MKILLRLFNTEGNATDGSRIPRSSCEEYLRSEDYQTIIANKLSLGGVTHKDRVLEEHYKGVIGMDDQIFVNDNVTHYITKLFFSGNDPFLYGEIELFDPRLFDGKRRDNILNLIGMLRSGVMLPVSVVIQAMWDTSNVARKIIRIKGVDFTNNPAFKGAGIVKIYSSNNSYSENDDFSEKSFSDDSYSNGLYIATKSFSAQVISVDGEVLDDLNASQKTYSYNDIVRMYGRNSREAMMTKGMSSISSSQLRKISFDSSDPSRNVDNELDTFTIDDGFRAPMTAVKYRERKPKFDQMMNSVPESEPYHDEMVEHSEKEFRDAITPDVKEFSYNNTNSIRDRLDMETYPRYTLIANIAKMYNKYWTEHRGMSQDAFTSVKEMFITDVSRMFKKVATKIKNGSTINSLFAMTQFTDEIAQASNELTKFYRDILISKDQIGFIPKMKYYNYKLASSTFYNMFCDYVFSEKFGRTDIMDIEDYKIQ
jgi:hypothetical protein